jgi:hypothetical protein
MIFPCGTRKETTCIVWCRTERPRFLVGGTKRERLPLCGRRTVFLELPSISVFNEWVMIHSQMVRHAPEIARSSPKNGTDRYYYITPEPLERIEGNWTKGKIIGQVKLIVC